MANFVTIENDNSKIKLQNLMFVWIFIWFVWILFHFTVIYFFWLVLDSVLLVWLFLWLRNLISLLVDIPVWIIQNYIRAKKILLIWASLLFLVSLIFFKFIFFQDLSRLTDTSSSIWDLLWEFLNSSLNIILLLLRAIMYWIIKELFDVTTLSYIFNNSTPWEYALLISKYWIHFGWWALIGLVLSWVLLALDIKIAISVFVVILFVFIFFILKFFDNSKETIEVKNIKNIKNVKVDLMLSALWQKASNVVQKITTKNLIELSKKTKLVFLKPNDDKDRKIDVNELYDETVKNFKILKKIMILMPINIVLLWWSMVMLIFWFWDTFVSTFQVEFLNKIIQNNSSTELIKNTGWIISWYVLLGLIALPAFLFQWFFIEKVKKYWVYNIIMFWTLLSWFSMICFWLSESIYAVIFFWVLNSIWYAAAMPNSQSIFWELYSIEYVKKYNLREVSSTFSRAPLRMMLNFANILWVVLGSILIAIFSFNIFFILFWLFILWVFVYSMLNLSTFNLLYQPTVEEVQDIKQIIEKDAKVDEDFV